MMFRPLFRSDYLGYGAHTSQAQIFAYDLLSRQVAPIELEDSDGRRDEDRRCPLSDNHVCGKVILFE